MTSRTYTSAYGIALNKGSCTRNFTLPCITLINSKRFENAYRVKRNAHVTTKTAAE